MLQLLIVAYHRLSVNELAGQFQIVLGNFLDLKPPLGLLVLLVLPVRTLAAVTTVSRHGTGNASALGRVLAFPVSHADDAFGEVVVFVDETYFLVQRQPGSRTHVH